MNSEDFRRLLPRGPLVEHICQIHEIINFLDDLGLDPNAKALAEYSLREIARYTASTGDLYDRAPLRRSIPIRPRPFKKGWKDS